MSNTMKKLTEPRPKSSREDGRSFIEQLKGGKFITVSFSSPDTLDQYAIDNCIDIEEADSIRSSGHIEAEGSSEDCQSSIGFSDADHFFVM